MKIALVASLAAVAATGSVLASENVEEVYDDDRYDNLPADEDPWSSRSLELSPVPLPIMCVLAVMNFLNALQEQLSEEGREAGEESGGRLSTLWRAVKKVPNVIYETGTMVAPLTFRYMLGEDQHPHCKQRMLCLINTQMKEQYGKPGEIAMQLASSMAGYAMGGEDATKYDSLVDAARNGRRGKDCVEQYPKCVARSDGGGIQNILRMAMNLMNKNN